MNRLQATDWLKPVKYDYRYDGHSWEATISGQDRYANEIIYARNKKSLDKKVIKFIERKRKAARLVLSLSGSETIP